MSDSSPDFELEPNFNPEAQPDEADSLIYELFLKIGSTFYQLAAVTPAPGAALKAWTLLKSDGEKYTVHLDGFGLHCTCGAFHWRKKQNEAFLCKHLAAMQHFGLLEANRARTHS